MARLLKKKTESEKRKKKDSSITSQVSQQDDYQAIAVQLKEEKKKQYIESQKSGSSSKTESDTEVEKESFFNKASVFFKEVRSELEKVVWPTKKQTILSTSAALVLVVIISVFLGIADSILGWIISFAFKS